MYLSLLFIGSNALAQPSAAKVTVEVAVHQPVIEEITLTGTVISAQVAELATEVSGLIASLAVDRGDRVQQGDVLLKLDSELHTLSLAVSRAVSDQARLEQDDAKRRLVNAEALAKRQTVSDNELQSLAAEVRIKAAALDGAKAEEQRQQALLRRYTLKAPFSGVINRKHVEIGEWVSVGHPVFTLIAADNLYVDFHVPQSVYVKMHQIASIEVNFEAVGQQGVKAKVKKVTPVVDAASRTFLVRVALDGGQGDVAPGMSASALLQLNSGDVGVVVPRDALLRHPDGRVTLWVMGVNGSDTIVTERHVSVGLSFAGLVAVTKGLSEGEQVVVQGNEALREGQLVSVVPRTLKD